MFVETKKKKILLSNVRRRPRQTFSSEDIWRRFCPKGAGQEESFSYRRSLNDQERSHCQRQHSISYLHDKQDDNAVHSDQERRWRKEGGRGEI